MNKTLSGFSCSEKLILEKSKRGTIFFFISLKKCFKKLKESMIEGKSSGFKKGKNNKPNKYHTDMLFKKFLNIGENFLNKFPLKKIVPILKRNKNRNFMWIVFFVIRFVKILKERTFTSKFNKLTLNHFSLINDKAKLPGDTFHLFRKTGTKNDNFLIRNVKKLIFTFL